jgi:hypothetical protein
MSTNLTKLHPSLTLNKLEFKMKKPFSLLEEGLSSEWRKSQDDLQNLIHEINCYSADRECSYTYDVVKSIPILTNPS